MKIRLKHAYSWTLIVSHLEPDTLTKPNVKYIFLQEKTKKGANFLKITSSDVSTDKRDLKIMLSWRPYTTGWYIFSSRPGQSRPFTKMIPKVRLSRKQTEIEFPPKLYFFFPPTQREFSMRYRIFRFARRYIYTHIQAAYAYIVVPGCEASAKISA